MATLNGDDQPDSLSGGSDADSISGAGGNDTLSGNGGADTIDGGTGDDSLFGGDDSDLFLIGSGAGFDTIFGGEGGASDQDTIQFSGPAVTVTFTGAEAGTYGIPGWEIASGSFSEIESFILTAGNDTVNGTNATSGMTIDAGAGNDTLQAGTGNDSLIGGTGDDFFRGGGGSDTMIGGAGNDTFSFLSSWGTVTVEGGDGTDWLELSNVNRPLTVTFTGTGAGTITEGTNSIAFTGIERITGSNTGDSIDASADTGPGLTLEGYSGSDTIIGGSGNDTIDGGSGYNSLVGGAGNDVILGGDQSDNITGGTGNDQIFGGGDSDTFQIGANDGVDTIDGGATGWDVDYLFFKNETPTTVTFTGNEAGTYTSGASTGTFTEIEGVQTGAGADSIDARASQMQLNVFAGAGNDTVTGSGAGDYISGGDGNDALSGGAGDDTISADMGNDTVDGGTGNDQIYTSAGMDLVYGGAGNDTITGTDGTKIYYGGDGNDSLVGNGGNDTLDGGTGNDTLSGAGGNDTLTGGAGSDSMLGGTGSDTFVISADAGTDTIVGGEDGIDTDSLRLSGSEGGTVTFSGTDAGSYTFGTASGTFSELEGVEGGSGNDLIDGTASAGRIRVTGGAGDDTIRGGSGTDSLSGETGADLIYGGAGSDTLEGGEGDDTLGGGAGNDRMLGGTGTDRFVLEEGFGADTIVGGENTGDADRVDFTGGTAPYTTAVSATFTGTGAGTATSGGNSVTFTEIEEISTGSGNDTISAAADAGGLRIETGAGDDSVTGGSGSDTILGGDGADTLAGGGGSDTIDGGDGADRLDGGAGDDVLTGGAGADVLVVSGGADRITDFDMTLIDGHTVDQIDVSDLLNAQGLPVTVRDVVVSQDAQGNAVLTFPGGISLALEGVTPEQVDGQLFTMGVPCFAAGTPILTPQGERPVDAIRPGDLVLTRDYGPQPVLWRAAFTLGPNDLARWPGLRPVRLRAGALAPGHRALTVSGQHGIVVRGHDGAEVLVRARHLAEFLGPAVRVAWGRRRVTYHHLLLPRHAILFAAGVPTESLYPGPMALAALAPGDRAALLEQLIALAQRRGMPQGIARPTDLYGPRARPLLHRAAAARLLRPAQTAPWLAPAPEPSHSATR